MLTNQEIDANNRQIALAAVRQCTAKRQAVMSQAYAEAVKDAGDRYLNDLTFIYSADLQTIRTLRYDNELAEIELRFVKAKQTTTHKALLRATILLGDRTKEGERK